MKCLTFVASAINSPNKNHFSYYYTSFFKLGIPKSLNIHFSSSNRPHKFSTNNGKLICVSNSISNPQIDGEHEEEKEYVQNLRVPHNWLNPSKALEESEWLRVTLHKWLDDEYCPEETNVEISKIAALSYYESLVEKETDLGEILLKMAIKLEGISYQESFHGAFSSANAAVNLILQRIVED